MVRFKLGKLEYESVNAYQVVTRLQGIPEVEITSVQRGLPPDGYQRAAYLWPGGRLSDPLGWRYSDFSTYVRYNYSMELGTIIEVRRKKTPMTKRVLQAVKLAELEPSQQIDDIVQFLIDRMGIKTIASFGRLERGSSRVYPPFLTYLKKIGEVEGRNLLHLDTDDGPFLNTSEYGLFENQGEYDLYGFEDLVRHIVNPTFIMANRDSRYLYYV